MSIQPTEWPQGIIARYLTIAGQALADPTVIVDVETLDTVDGDPYGTRSTCRACAAWDDWEYTDYRNYSEEASRAAASQSDARAWAQAHAEKCRALPRPGGAA